MEVVEINNLFDPTTIEVGIIELRTEIYDIFENS